MTKQQRERKVQALSGRARRTYDLIQRGRWYNYSHEGKPAIEELVRAGLIRLIGRAARLELAYLPTNVRPMKHEVWPK